MSRINDIMNGEIFKILVERDEMSEGDAIELIEEAVDQLGEGCDDANICEEYFGLEIDYLMELMNYV
jgi:hypothetical protein